MKNKHLHKSVVCVSTHINLKYMATKSHQLLSLSAMDQKALLGEAFGKMDVFSVPVLVVKSCWSEG